jgi:hypothetical protein
MMVPNVSWGLILGLHECDILRVTDSRYAHEIEIKISKADLIADKKKRHGHSHELLRTLTFAIPEDLYGPCYEHIPSHAGILTVDEYGRCTEQRKPMIDKGARKLTEKEYLKVGKLASMRIWKMMSAGGTR